MYFTANTQFIDAVFNKQQKIMILNNCLRESGRTFNDAKTQLRGLYFKMLNNREQLDQFVNTRNDKGLIEFVCIGFSLLKYRLL